MEPQGSAQREGQVFGILGNLSVPGEIDGVIFRNISTKGPGPKKIRIEGWSKDKQVRNVTLKNVVINDKRVTTHSRHLVTSDHVSEDGLLRVFRESEAERDKVKGGNLAQLLSR